jgi:two-component system response regulator HydG
LPVNLPKVLVCDDEAGVAQLLSRFAETHGFNVVSCTGGTEACRLVSEQRPDLALVDLRMPDMDGLSVLRAIRAAEPACQVILMTAHASIDSAVEAIKVGALDYVTKPFDFDRLEQLLAGVREEAARRQRVVVAEEEISRELEFADMVGRGPAMQQLFEMIRRLAPHVRTALITGETGTGKELVARALHTNSPRRARRFVAVNCAAVVDSLFESELFGHVRGAFTGATETKVGLFEAADGGTLFLDEVGDLPLALQAKLLRVLETGEVRRVGSLDSRGIDVMVVAATNRHLTADVDDGRFRRDLLYRLNVVELHLQPLRARREDIPYLTARFVRDIAERLGRDVRGLTTAAEGMLLANPWPGNVRELHNVIERLCLMADGPLITDRDVARCIQPAATRRPVSAPVRILGHSEREQVVRALQQARGNKNLAANLLGISRFALYRRIERFELDESAESDRAPVSASAR